MSGNVMQTFKNTCFLCEIRQSHADYILYISKEYLWPKCNQIYMFALLVLRLKPSSQIYYLHYLNRIWGVSVNTP